MIVVTRDSDNVDPTNQDGVDSLQMWQSLSLAITARIKMHQ